MSNSPVLSVVIAATDSPEAIGRSLESLQAGSASFPVQVIVAAPSDLAAEVDVQDFRCDWISAEPGTGVPRLRRLGLERAKADLVAFTEDSCVFERDWAWAWVEAFRSPELLAGSGDVQPRLGISPVDWGVFFCEYAPFMAGQGPRPSRLAGNNFAVRVGAVPLAGEEIHEAEVALTLLGRPDAMASIPALAYHVRRFGFIEAVRDRFRFGLDFGGLRARRHSRRLQRVAILMGPAIFAIQLARLAKTVLASRQHIGQFVMSLPLIGLLLATWSLGESLGWAFAPRDRPAGDRRRGTTARRASPQTDPARS